MSEVIYLAIYGAINSVVYGLLLFLLASGLTVIFGMLGVLNVAHASFYMLGAYLAYTSVSSGWNFWIALLLAPLFVAVLGGLTERYLLRSIRKYGHGHELLLTLGLSFVILELVKWIWGTEPHPVPVPALLEGSIPILDSAYPIYRLFIAFAGIVILGGMFLVIYRTKLGMIVRAAVSDSTMVRAMGYDVDKLFTGVFAMGTWLAGVAGVIAAPMLSVYPGLATNALVDMFIVVVVGGLGSLMGAFIASLLLGTMQSIGVLVVPKLAMMFGFILLAVVIVWRPLGLFGEREA
ncbi:MAG: branched-chain amino acid ABC transporter permease [Hyphomicrobiales bacterium]